MLNENTLREGIFALNTRRFGSVAELMIKRLFRLGKSKSQFHDLYDDMEKKRVEVKFSRVLKTSEIKISEENVLVAIEESISSERMLNKIDITSKAFDCNIQQIKKTEFDILWTFLL